MLQNVQNSLQGSSVFRNILDYSSKVMGQRANCQTTCRLQGCWTKLKVIVKTVFFGNILLASFSQVNYNYQLPLFCYKTFQCNTNIKFLTKYEYEYIRNHQVDRIQIFEYYSTNIRILFDEYLNIQWNAAIVIKFFIPQIPRSQLCH